jgi:hypothetical protein
MALGRWLLLCRPSNPQGDLRIFRSTPLCPRRSYGPPMPLNGEFVKSVEELGPWANLVIERIWNESFSRSLLTKILNWETPLRLSCWYKTIDITRANYFEFKSWTLWNIPQRTLTGRKRSDVIFGKFSSANWSFLVSLWKDYGQILDLMLRTHFYYQCSLRSRLGGKEYSLYNRKPNVRMGLMR